MIGEEAMNIIHKIIHAFPLIEGRTYFSKQTERHLFFILTVIMLIIGALSGLNII